MTKQQVIESKGQFLPNSFMDGLFDLDGTLLAAALEKLGFEIAEHYDAGRYGIVKTVEGIQVHTNGYVRSMVFDLLP